MELLVSILALGSTYALLAAGIVIIYKASRVINFAHGELAIVGAYVFHSAGFLTGTTLTSLSLFTAIVVAATASALFGVVIYFALMRRLLGRPTFVAAMVTIGCVDHAVRCAGLCNQEVAVIETADHRFDPELLQFIDLFRKPNEPGHCMPVTNESRRNGSADKAACACHKDFHVRCPVWRVDACSIGAFDFLRNGVSLKSILTQNQ